VLRSEKEEVGPVNQVCPPRLNLSVALSKSLNSKGGKKKEIPPLIAEGRNVTLFHVHENFVKGILKRIGRGPTFS
jgi:hypothetical protein